MDSAWLGGHWLEALQTVGVPVGLFATAFSIFTAAYSIYDNTRTQKVENLFDITKEHRAIWSEMLRSPELKRVLDPKADLASAPVSLQERIFTRSLILHFSSVHQIMKGGQLNRIEGLSADMRQFFSRPIPRAVWIEMRPYQEPDFAKCVDRAIQHKQTA